MGCSTRTCHWVNKSHLLALYSQIPPSDRRVYNWRFPAENHAHVLRKELLALSCSLQFEISRTAHFRQGLQLRITGLTEFESEYQKLLKKTVCITFPGHNIQCHMCVTSFIFIPPDKPNFFSPYPPLCTPHINEFNQMWYTCMQHWNCMEGLLSRLHFSVHYLIHSTTKSACAHEDWTIGWSANGPYNQPLAIWR
jgi:hypothetical protein